MTATASAENQTAAEPVVTLTPAAIRQIKRQMARTGGENKRLRLGVKGGGCSGLSYVLLFEEASDTADSVWETEGLSVVVDPKSARFLAGATLDYSLKNLMEGGFIFHNPNASRSCGCGTSFTPR
jgi:iron-sulfur cluster assembly protein